MRLWLPRLLRERAGRRGAPAAARTRPWMAAVPVPLRTRNVSSQSCLHHVRAGVGWLGGRARKGKEGREGQRGSTPVQHWRGKAPKPTVSPGRRPWRPVPGSFQGWEAGKGLRAPVDGRAAAWRKRLQPQLQPLQAVLLEPRKCDVGEAGDGVLACGAASRSH